MMNTLTALAERLQELEALPRPAKYEIPVLWKRWDSKAKKRVTNVDPIEFYQDCIGDILSGPDETPVIVTSAGAWTKYSVTYNLFVRQTTAWDHDGDGVIRIDDPEDGFRETGTFLKAIALLPMLKHMGFNTIQLLPVTLIGEDGRKGSLGSPYAIKNPYKLDPRLAEPWLGLGVDAEFDAFVEAAHHLGMRVLMEFVFRTASKDSEWIREHPNWFYWIDAAVPDREMQNGSGYGSPHFSEDELRLIHLRLKRNDMHSLPPPGRDFRTMFVDYPDEVEWIDGSYIGTLDGKRKCRIPGAFADWPPNDVQPPWNDVTYLKLYDQDGFNYIAYNTVRMYDARLATIDNENRGLWNMIISIIPHYQERFGIDGVMIDMGHALPKRLKQAIIDRARKVNPDFAFWEENFAIHERSRKEGYNATFGYLWSEEHLPNKLREFVSMLSSHETPIPFFATPESHNTPRASARPGGIRFSKMAYVVNSFLPAIPYVHQGFEVGETHPVNTGLGFSTEQNGTFPSAVLPLFSEARLSWENPDHLVDLISTVNSIRQEWELVVTNPSPTTLHILSSTDDRVLVFIRTSLDQNHAIAIVANMDCENSVQARVKLRNSVNLVTDALTNESFEVKNGSLPMNFEPGRTYIFPLSDPLK